MNRNNQDFFSLLDLVGDAYVRNRQNLLGGLGMRTSADVFEAAQKEYEEARLDRQFAREWNGRQGSVASHEVVATAEEDVAQEDRVVESTVRPPQRKRKYVGRTDQKWPKRARAVVRRERSDDEQMEELAGVLRYLEEEFAEKERLSDRKAWCTPIPLDRKVSTVQEFYKAFHDRNTLPIHTCRICYRKFGRTELQEVGWDLWMASHIEKRNNSPFKCSSCFPMEQRILTCVDCVRHLRRGALSSAAMLHAKLGCEHMFPDELKGLTPIEEKLIALNACYGFITKYSISKGQRQNVTYPKHVKGHITVFPNNVQELVTNVLPHPLLKVMDEIHVSWQGREKPAPSDLSVLLSVRRHVVERALVLLKRHNPLYANIDIDTAEMDSWETPAHGVPSQVYGRLERNEPSAWEKVRTGQVVPPTERGLEEDGPVDIREVIAMLGQEGDAVSNRHEAEAEEGCEDGGDGEDGDRDADLNGANETIHEIGSSGMFALDAGPDIADAEKLQYVCNALGQDGFCDQTSGSTWVGSAEVRHEHASEPYIVGSRGEEVADAFDTWFCAK